MKNIKVLSCMKGIVKELKLSKDEAFAQGLSGDGVIITPLSNLIVSPFDGQVVIVFVTNHAIILRGNDGLAMIIHIGVEIGKLNGKGFKVHVIDGQDIKEGDLLLEIDIPYLKTIHYDIDTHILFPSMGIRELVDIQYGNIDFLERICNIK